MSYSEKWQNARQRRADRRASDPRVQARARAHRLREESRTERARRAAQVDLAVAHHLDGAA